MNNLVKLTIEWDAYRDPTPLECFGLDADVTGLPSVARNNSVWFPHKADVAWNWLVDNGYVPTGKVEQVSPRKPFGGFVRLVAVDFVKEVEPC